MAFKNYIISVFASMALAKALALEAPIAGYGVEEISWEVKVPTGGTEILNGTVQDVLAQVSQLHPQFGEQLLAKVNTFAAESVQQSRQAHQARSSDKLRKRDNTLCDVQNWGGASVFRTNENIGYLRGVGGQPRNGPGPGNCARVACQWSSAVWWCNDNRGDKTLYGFNRIADGAQVVVNDCWRPIDYVQGQRFDNDNVNFIVRGDDC